MAAPHLRWRRPARGFPSSGRKWRPLRAEVASAQGGRGSRDQDGGEEGLRAGPGGGSAAGPGPGDPAAAAEPAAGGFGERQLRGRSAGRAAPARETPPTLRRYRRDREEKEKNPGRPFQTALPQEFPGAAGGAEPERGRGSQLRLGVRRPFPPAPAPFLCRLRFPFGVHLRHLRRPVLLQPLPRHPPGHPVLEVDGVTGMPPPPPLFGDNKRSRVSTAPVSVLVSPAERGLGLSLAAAGVRPRWPPTHRPFKRHALGVATRWPTPTEALFRAKNLCFSTENPPRERAGAEPAPPL